jgi:hypothetical protein
MHSTNFLTLHAVYTNRNGQRLQPYHLDTRAGRINTRVHVHNFTTGYDETWSVRLFVAEHAREQNVGREKGCLI